MKSLLLLSLIGLPFLLQDAAPDPVTSLPDDVTALKALLLAERDARAGSERALEEQCEELRRRIAELELELATAVEKRMAREAEWLQYTKAIVQFNGQALPASIAFQSELAEADAIQEEQLTAEKEALVKRSREVFLSLRSLFMVEGIDGYDLLESGTVGDGFTGPIVLRVLDELRRPVGSLSAERLRFEASRSGHTLTMIFEEGYERRSGLKFPFAGGSMENLSKGVRRIVLPQVDPRPWMEAIPELFRIDENVQDLDDGIWENGDVRSALNELLRENAARGFYQVHSFAGIRDEELRDVQLERLDVAGKLERKLFADRCSISSDDRGIRITLESGVQLRGDRKVPFRDDRYLIFLPRARVEAWRAAGIPGISTPTRWRDDDEGAQTDADQAPGSAAGTGDGE